MVRTRVNALRLTALVLAMAGAVFGQQPGEYGEIGERWVADILPPPVWERYGLAVLLAAWAVLLALAGALIWNRQLRRRVELRTRQLDGALQERASLINAIDGIVWERDVAWQAGAPALNMRFISDQAAGLLGYSVERWLSESGFWEEQVFSADRTAATQGLLDGVRSGTDFRIEYRMTHATGKIVWIRDVISVRCADGRPAVLRGIMIDITAEKQAIEGLAENERRYRELVEGSPDAILILRRDEIVFVNPSAVQMLGASSAAALIGRASSDLVHPDYRALVAERHSAVCMRNAPVPPVEEKILKVDGATLDVEASAAPYREAGELMIRVILRDITKRKEAEQQLIHQAFHDPLTQLPNRALLFERLRHRMALSERFGDKAFAVLFLDLDRFKLVNDSLGHWMGDLLLLHVRERIQSVLDPWDTLARLGGDEFTILIEQFGSRSDLERLSDRIHSALSPTIELGGNQVFVTASIGVAVGATGYEEAEEVMRDADTAMYRAKAVGRAQTVFFDEEMRHVAVASLALERDLRLAARAEEFLLHYQPIISLASGSTIGVEALIRWNHPIRGLLLPSEFLACASEGGMITQLDSWALEMACKEARQSNWLRPGVRLSVNVSGRGLLRPDFAGSVSRILDQTGLQPVQLAIEITEQVLVESSQCISELERLRALGVELFLDDFGTGYSSLSYLTLFPISRLKIDRSFIQRLELGGRDLTVVRMVLALADGLDLEVTAEGVENAQQAEMLRSMGCQSAQGHYFSRAVEAARVGALINCGGG